MRKNILIPTDFSENAWNALSYALNLFKDEKCTFYLLNAYQNYQLTTDILMDPDPDNPKYLKAKEKSETGLEDLIAGIAHRSENPRHRFEKLSTYNSVLEAIREAVKSKDIEMIVMGTKGENNPIQKIYGSTAVDVIENLYCCPTLIIPENSSFIEGEKKEIVFATNYKTFYKRKELKDLVNTARLYDAAIRVLHIQNTDKMTAEQEVNKGMLEDILEDVDHSFHSLAHKKIAEGINSFIASRESHMLAMINKKHNFFYNLFLQPLVKEIGYDSMVPVLVLHLKRK